MRVMFTTHALPSHFQPLVPLARAVRDAGHGAVFATGPEFVAADQFLHAGRCSALGAARTLDVPSVSPDSVRDAVCAVLHEPSYRDSALSLRAEIAAMPGVKHAVALLEELVREGEPPTRR